MVLKLLLILHFKFFYYTILNGKIFFVKLLAVLCLVCMILSVGKD